MEISANTISNITQAKQIPALAKQTGTFRAENSTELSSIDSVGSSLVNTNLPVSYTKIAEIQIPGLDKNACIYKLSNGQKVVICPKKGRTFIKTTYNVGSLNESESNRGISHYIEHNLFNGSKGINPGEYNSILSQMGGYTNASTFLNFTDYYLSLQLLHPDSLEKAIQLNAALTQFPTFPNDQLEREKEPVKSEIDQDRDIPDFISENIIIKNLFGISSDSFDLTLGTKDNINSFNRDKVLDYFDTWYTPDNAVTVITGDVDTNETIKLAAKYYNKQNNYSKINQRSYQPLNYLQQTKRTDIIMPNSTDSNISMGFAVPEGTSKSDIKKLNVLLALLGSNNSRLSKILDKYGISPQISMFDIQNKPDSAKYINFKLNASEENLEEILQILYQELSFIANYPPSSMELDSIKSKLLYDINNSSENSEMLNQTLTDMVKGNDLNYYNDYYQIINTITPNEISDVARRFLDLNKTAICVSHSKEATPKSINDNYNNKNSAYKVSFGASFSPKDSITEEVQKIRDFTLPNNVQTKFVPCSNNVKSSFVMSYNTDELNDTPSAAFDILSIILSRGSAYKSNDVMENIKNLRDFNFNFTVSPDGIMAHANFYQKDAIDAINLFKEIISAPNFSNQEFERAKQIVKNKILAENKSPNTKLLTELLPDIKSHASKEQKLNELDKLTLADIQNLYTRIFSTSQVRTTVSAPVDTNPALYDLYNSCFANGFYASRPVSQEKSASYNIYKPNNHEKILKDIEDNSQAKIVKAYKYKYSENIDDIAKIELLNIILGDGMDSRLFQDLRVNQKLAYHAASSLCKIKDTGMLILDVATTTESPDPKEGSPENITKALNGFDRNIEALKTTPVSQKELDVAKNIFKTYILNDFETSDSKLLSFHSSGNSPYNNHYKEALIDAIDKVSIEDIKSAANYVFNNPPVTSIVASQNTFNALKL